jgi:hypothetical protein
MDRFSAPFGVSLKHQKRGLISEALKRLFRFSHKRRGLQKINPAPRGS